MRHRAPALITLLTDFGQADSYVAQMQGVILNMLPGAKIVHLGHEIPPQDIVQAGFFLLSCYNYYPPGTIHVVVVDPGVGTPRKILAIETRRYKFLVPDNGLIAPVLEKAGPLRIIELNQGRYCRKPTSRTFHGRDCFAPAAARLAAGLNIRKLGQSINPLRIHPGKLWPPAKILKGHLDIFIPKDELEQSTGVVPTEDDSIEMNMYLTRNVNELELSVRAANCLKNAKIKTIGDLVQKTEGEMLRTKNFGKKSLNEIKEMLVDMGLGLGMKPDTVSQKSTSDK